MSKVVIFHNPKCSNARGALELLRNAGIEPEIRLYLENPPSVDELRRLLAALKMPARALLRRKEKIYAELALDDPKWTEDQLLEQMHQHPILIERPIVVTSVGTRVCRPPETVLDILP
jgi:arsenate reductase